MRVRPGTDAHRIDGLVRDNLGPVAVSLRNVQFLRRLLARRQTAVGNADNLDAVLRAQARNVSGPRIGAGADDTDAECVCCHGWFILVRATFGMAREEYSTIVTARPDVNFGWLREVRQRRSGRRDEAAPIRQTPLVGNGRGERTWHVSTTRWC